VGFASTAKAHNDRRAVMNDHLVYLASFDLERGYSRTPFEDLERDGGKLAS
jgi:hypothetical protein